MNAFDEMERQTRGPGGECSVGKLLSELDDKRRADLVDALVRHRTGVIVKVLREWGHPISEHSISRHRHKRCRCDDE